MKYPLNRSLLFALATGAVLMPSSMAAEDKTETHALEPIRITAKREQEPVTSPYAIPESSKLQTETFTREEIEALHPESVWEVLEQAPGMEATFQGRQHLNFSNMRGNGSYGVLLDGIYISQADRVLSTLPVDSIESMTIVRDASALTLGPLTSFGSNTGASNQGFVIIKTKRSSKQEGGFVASLGTYDAEKEHLYYGSKSGNFDYRFSGTYQDNPGREGWNNGSRNASFLFRGGYSGDTVNADFIYYASDGMRQMQYGKVLVPTTTKNGTLDWSQVGTLKRDTMNMNKLSPEMVAMNLTKTWSATQSTVFQFAYNGIGVEVTEQPQNSYGKNITLRQVMTFQNNVLRVGGQYLAYHCPYGSAPSVGKPTNEEMYSLFAEDEQRLMGDRLVLDGGIRADKKHYNNSPLTGLPTDEWAKETLACTLGASFKVAPIVTLTGRYAYTENPQSGNQISVDKSILPAEKRNRYEAGLLINVHPTFNPALTVYRYDTKNQKVSATGIDPNTGKSATSYIDATTGEEIQFVTASDVMTKGAEISVSGQIASPISYRMNYSYVTTDDDTTNAGMSRHLASASLRYHYKDFGANVSAHYAGPKNRTSSPAGVIYYELGDYTRVDANVSYKFQISKRDAQITLYGRNLGNVHYATRYVTGAYEDPGCTVGLQLACSVF